MVDLGQREISLDEFKGVCGGLKGWGGGGRLSEPERPECEDKKIGQAKSLRKMQNSRDNRSAIEMQGNYCWYKSKMNEFLNYKMEIKIDR